MFIDTHAHIYLDQFKNDLDDILERCQEAKVSQILMPNIDVTTLNDVLRCAEQFPAICKPMIGLHPCSVNGSWKESLKTLEAYLKLDNIVAIGEMGIDLYWDQTFKKEQEKAFLLQINWAIDKDLPIVIHSRAAIDITIKLVSQMQNGNLRGVFHCFDQSEEHARKIMDLGFYMGLGGIITYKKNNDLRSTISNLPLESIILETDAPYLPPVPYRGKRNESSYIPIIAEKLAEIHDKPIQQIGQITTINAKSLFGI